MTMIAERRGAVRTDTADVAVVAGPSIDEVDRLDVLLVPGAGNRGTVAAMNNERSCVGSARSTGTANGRPPCAPAASSSRRPLLADRGFAVPDRPGIRLRPLEDVFAYGAAEGVTLRIDGMETQVRRPRAGRPGRRAFVSGKRRQNTVRTITISDGQGPTLWSGAQRPGRMHDQTAVRTEGIAEQFHRHPGVEVEVDDGCRGLANEFPDQVSAPPRKPKGMKAPNDEPVTERYGWREMKRRQSSRRFRAEHANAEVRQWRPIQRCTCRRETYGESHHAIAVLVSGRAVKRPTRHKTSIELMHVRATAC